MKNLIGYILIMPIYLTWACEHAKIVEIPSVPPPSWVFEDCVEKDGYYYFLGYGEGRNLATALSQALLTSRKSALTCLFGGKMKVTTNVVESTKDIEYSGTLDSQLSIDSMNWQGFEQVERRNYVPPSEPNKVYVQYKWSSKIIAAEKYRLAAQAEDSLGKSSKNTIEASSGSDSSHLTDQTSNTNLESDPIKQLASLKKESERLGLEFRQIVSNLICGMTINQLAKLYREYDRFELRSLELKNGYVQYFAFFWGEYSVRIYDPYILKNRPPERLSYSNSELFISGAREVPIVYVYDQFDRGNLIAKVCPKF